jgi:2-haloacid dehalogenase
MTGYVKRPLERGEGRRPPRYEEGEFDVVADDFIDLDAKLGR